MFYLSMKSPPQGGGCWSNIPMEGRGDTNNSEGWRLIPNRTLSRILIRLPYCDTFWSSSFLSFDIFFGGGGKWVFVKKLMWNKVWTQRWLPYRFNILLLCNQKIHSCCVVRSNMKLTRENYGNYPFRGVNYAV